VHAILWNGAADRFVDLGTAGFDFSEASAVRNGQVVGMGSNFAIGNGPGAQHALVWTRQSPDSVIDLQQFVPASTGFGLSAATAIDEHGNIFGFVSTDGVTVLHAAEWIPQAHTVPLPRVVWPGLLCLGGLAAGLMIRRRVSALP
jgi:hypothetical protein